MTTRHSIDSHPAGGASSRTSTSRDLLDSFRVPLILMDRKRKVIHANPPAERLLSERRLIEATDGRLSCCQPENNVELSGALEVLFLEIDANAQTMPRRRVVPLIRPGGGCVPAVLLTIRRSGRHGEGAASHHALLSVVEPSDPLPDVQAIRRIFGLTAAEGRLAAMMATGRSPVLCARELDVKISTVRSQLNAIYRKTGAAGQAHLVRLILWMTVL